MTNKEKLIRDLVLIAKNHNLNANVEDFINDEDCPCIYGGCNVPTIADIQMLCASVGLSEDSIDTSDFGIEIIISENWYDNIMNQEWTPQYETWLRAEQTQVKLV